MPEATWQQPLRDLQSQLQTMVEAKVQIYHSVFVAPRHDWASFRELVPWMEPSFMGQEFERFIETPTEGCSFHGHLFFGVTSHVRKLQAMLGSLHHWLRRVPKGLIPACYLPATLSQTDMNLVAWCNILLSIGWTSRRWYFAADINVQEKLDEVYSFPWIELRHPSGVDAYSVLTHQNSSTIPFSKWQRLFEQESLDMPEVIEMYLVDAGEAICAELLKASVAGIDVILSAPELESRRTEMAVHPKAFRRQRKSSKDRIKSEVMKLRGLLLERHVFGEDYEERRAIMTQEEMAKELDWVSEEGKPLQPKVHRRLTELLGDASLYKSCFVSDVAFERFTAKLRETRT